MKHKIHIEMISKVAKALGKEVLENVAFVGGCTTALFITDDFFKDQVRHTDDVDLIIDVISHNDFQDFQESLVKNGFSHDLTGDSPICAMLYGDLRVDFMPTQEKIIGFSNLWYPEALKTARKIRISKDIQIRVVTAPYFVATKFEAYKGRGKNDALSSTDIEDILTVFSGREEIVKEILSSKDDLKKYIQNEFISLLNDTNFSYAVTSAAGSNDGMEECIWGRIREVIGEF